MLIVEEKGKRHAIRAEKIDANKLGCLKSKLVLKIIQALASSKEALTAKQLAGMLDKHEQLIYYHLRKLEDGGILEKVKTGVARGFDVYGYKVKANAFYFVLKKKRERIEEEVKDGEEEINKFLFPFVEEGRLNSIIIIGSPEPHGIEKARSKDAFFVIDLALLLGSFLNKVEGPISMFDTEIKDKEVLKNNLIVVGGPIVNTLTYKINEKLPIVFLKKEKAFLVRQSGKKYYDDEIGIIIKCKNPFAKNKELLMIEGKRYIGTRACVIAFMKYLYELSKRINEKGYAVVRGYDADSDGVIDDVQFLG
jgi:predicted transcriptional regulator